jgi:hypothetical protein
LSQLECSSWTSSMVASWVVLRLKHGGRQCWGVTENRIDPRTQEKNVGKRSSQSHRWRKRRQRVSPKTARTSKVVNPLTRALTLPFIERRRDFYIPTVPLNSKNIPSVNTYTNVFYISYIYKPATSSHVKLGLFEMATLTLLLASSRMFSFRKSSRTVTHELVLHHIPEFHRFPKFVASQVHGFESSRIRDFKA